MGLRSRIIQDLFVEQWADVWFFPSSERHSEVAPGVRGWSGIQDIFFVGLNPSTGQFPNKADRFLYEALAHSRLQNAHLTDVIKLRATDSQVEHMLNDNQLMNQQREYFFEELAILSPRLVVTMGKRATDAVTQWLPSSAKIRPIPHYSPRIPSDANKEGFRTALRAVAAEYAESNGPVGRRS